MQEFKRMPNWPHSSLSEEDKPTEKTYSTSLLPLKGLSPKNKGIGGFLKMPFGFDQNPNKCQGSVVIGVTEKGFVPDCITIWEGATVIFQIRGEQKNYFDYRPRQHVLCLDEGEGFQSELLSPGGQFEHTFQKKGTYKVVCLIQTKLKCVVQVKPPPAQELKPSDLYTETSIQLRNAAIGMKPESRGNSSSKVWNQTRDLGEVQRRIKLQKLEQERKQQAERKKREEEESRTVHSISGGSDIAEYVLRNHQEFNEKFTQLYVGISTSSEEEREEEDEQAKSDEQEQAEFIKQQRESSKSRTPSFAHFKNVEESGKKSAHGRSASDGRECEKKETHQNDINKSQSAKETHKMQTRLNQDEEGEKLEMVKRRLNYEEEEKEQIKTRIVCHDMVTVSHCVKPTKSEPIREEEQQDREKQRLLKYTVRYQGWNERGLRDEVVFKRGEIEEHLYIDEEEGETVPLKKRKSKPKQTEEQRRVKNKKKKEKLKQNKRLLRVLEQLAGLFEQFDEEQEEENEEMREIWKMLEQRSEENERRVQEALRV